MTADRLGPDDDRGEGPAQGRDARRRGRLPQPVHRAPKAGDEPEGRARPTDRHHPGPPTPDDQRVLVVRSIELDGPYNPPAAGPARDATGGSWTTGPTCRRARPPARSSRRFADRAFRRPVKPEEVERLLKLYDQAEKEGERFEDRVRLALEGVLVWPALPVPRRARPARRQAGDELPDQRVRAGQPALVLPLEQHARRRAVRPGGEGASCGENLDAQVRRMLARPEVGRLRRRTSPGSG